MKKGEKVFRIIANSTFNCEECGRTILIGQSFLLDKIPYPSYGGLVGTQDNFHNHRICEGCWKGSKRGIITLTRTNTKLRRYERIHRKNY